MPSAADTQKTQQETIARIQAASDMTPEQKAAAIAAERARWDQLKASGPGSGSAAPK